MKNNLEFTLATGVYVAGLTVDYFSTAIGLTSNQIMEINPLYQISISHFGIHQGLLIPKLLLGGSVIALSKYADGKPMLRNKIKFKAKHFLYSGALITSTIGLGWLIEKHIL